jgi:hypothetical protein
MIEIQKVKLKHKILTYKLKENFDENSLKFKLTLDSILH